MKQKLTLASALLLLFLGSTISRGQTPSQTDTQQWTDVQLAVPVTREIDWDDLTI